MCKEERNEQGQMVMVERRYYVNGEFNEKFLENIKEKIDPNKKIAIICRSGVRSLRASELLVQNGYKDVINLSGGMLLATQKGLDIVKP